MNFTLLMSLILVFTFLCLIYVYKFRGTVRFAGASEYISKGWPIFAPLNCLLYIFTRPHAKVAIMDTEKFPELKEIAKHWETIREEAIGLYEEGMFEKTKDPNSSSYYDIGFRTFYKYGWGKFYLNWYGHTHPSALKRCPKTVELLKTIPTVNGAMFSILPVGSKLTRHLDPVACSLRYHLGLRTPNHNDCFINVDGTDYSWRDGESFIFDETYLHYANNNSEEPRIILMCDIERPLFLIGSLVNQIYKVFMRATLVPNTSEDPTGVANKIFSTLSPVLAKSKNLKKTNFFAYKVLKYTVNTLLALILFAIIYGFYKLVAFAL